MILNRQRTVRVARPPLEAFLARVREQLRLNGAEITVCLVTDKSIAHMNQTFRHKKGPTDVLSFPSDDSAERNGNSRRRARSAAHRRARKVYAVAASRQGTASAVPNSAKIEGASAPEGHSLGDIAISPATARRNAKKLGRTLPGELQILILHGVLHLLGYDHETDNGQMTRVENRLRRKLGLQ
jgi:probable rRNA maturation factor